MPGSPSISGWRSASSLRLRFFIFASLASAGMWLVFVAPVLVLATVVSVTREARDRMRAWLTVHNRGVINAILVVFGVLLAARGLTGLL